MGEHEAFQLGDRVCLKNNLSKRGTVVDLDPDPDNEDWLFCWVWWGKDNYTYESADQMVLMLRGHHRAVAVGHRGGGIT